MSSDDERRLEEAEQAVFDEQESNERATAGTSQRDDDQADEMADEASTESEAATED
jgi:hypothetical protein